MERTIRIGEISDGRSEVGESVREWHGVGYIRYMGGFLCFGLGVYSKVGGARMDTENSSVF